MPDNDLVDLFVTRHLKLALNWTLYRTAKLRGLSVIPEDKPYAWNCIRDFTLDLVQLPRLECGRLQNLVEIGWILKIVFVVLFATQTWEPELAQDNIFAVVDLWGDSKLRIWILHHYNRFLNALLTWQVLILGLILVPDHIIIDADKLLNAFWGKSWYVLFAHCNQLLKENLTVKLL